MLLQLQNTNQLNKSIEIIIETKGLPACLSGSSKVGLSF